MLMPGAISSVLEGCKKKPICMHLNTSNITNEKTNSVGSARYKEQGFLLYTDKNDFIKEVGIYCTFISSLVYKTAYVKNVPNKSQYFGTNILQSHFLFESMKNEGKYIINTKNCVAERANCVVHYDLFKTWITNYSELMLVTAPACGFDESIMSDLLEHDLSETILDFILYFRRTCKEIESSWDRVSIWKYLKKYPRIEKKYRVVINCPLYQLHFLSIYEKTIRKFRKK